MIFLRIGLGIFWNLTAQIVRRDAVAWYLSLLGMPLPIEFSEASSEPVYQPEARGPAGVLRVVLPIRALINRSSFVPSDLLSS